MLATGATAATPAGALDWRTAASVLALVISFISYRRTRKVDRRNVFVDIHSRLLEPELVAARRRLYGLTSVAEVDALDEADRTHLYRLLAMFDLLGLYAKSRWVDVEDVLDEWGDTLNRSRPAAAHVIAWRSRVTTSATWPHYQRLAEQAAKRADLGRPRARWRRWGRRIGLRWL